MPQAFQTPNGCFITDAKVPGNDCNILIRNGLRSGARANFNLALTISRYVVYDLRLAAWPSLIELTQLIFNAIGGHQKCCSKGVRSLFDKFACVALLGQAHGLGSVE